MVTVERTDTFNEDVAGRVETLRVLNDIEYAITTIQTIPTVGSSHLPESILQQFGNGVRKISCPPFLIIYEYFPSENRAVVYGLIHERQAY
ncbi:hypothetical protein [Raoultibacter phocaeensis]|uniref:hypothetical protein n=1 Tax=Raoultibacter phocaeensis TaxID=2479841 RepID=UPI001118A0E0|nr:hypothetical protein [Raoultibacter phocaeensis]